MSRPATALAVLVTSAFALPTAARADDRDPWLGHDKLLHFEASAAIAAGGYGGAALLSDDVRVRLAAGAAIGITAGVAKELWDLSGHGDASWRDLTWDAIGTASGLAVALTIDWAVSRLLRRRSVEAAR
jgi:putative lipoprotein